MSKTESYVVACESNLRIETESDVFDAIEKSGRRGRLLVTEEDVCPHFFDLRTGLAGEVFQKFVTYDVLVAFVVEAPSRYSPRFVELAREHGRHPQIRITTSRADAESWLSA